MVEKRLEVFETATSEAPKGDLIEPGQWYWVKDADDGPWLGCVTHVGSNYAQLDSPHRQFCRIHFDKFDKRIDRREFNPDAVIEAHVREHQKRVNALLDDIKQLTAKLGLTPVGELTDGGTSTALVVAHRTKDIKAHKNALIKAKEKTLPDLFKKVGEEHEEMAIWMKAKLIPMKAQAETLKKSTESIEDRIFTVELYAGLCEEVVKIRKGEPAGNDEKVHLFQRRHYMDEECLVNYSAGGMEFKDIAAFDRWLMKKANRERILPMPKCVVAFQVRHGKKEREAASLQDFIKFLDLEAADELTFLYIRNGDSCYRLSTAINFGHQLFPDEERSDLLHGQLYVEDCFRHDIISEQQYIGMQEDRAETKKEHERELAEWKKTPKEDRKSCFEPYYHEPYNSYESLTPDSVYYDDGMTQVADAARDHNRIAVVLQGLLDRSPVFHPHPPWKLWTAEGFSSGVELVYDDTRGITVGDAPDFEGYRDALNAGIKKGTHTVGQQRAWERVEAEKENRRQDNDWRVRDPFRYKYFTPYGNPGPGKVAQVSLVSRGGKHCVFQWKRERLRHRWYDDSSGINTRFRCSSKLLLNVDAYSVGDYKRFYDDPRTRADYLKWAPLLLAAEDFHAKKGKRCG